MSTVRLRSLRNKLSLLFFGIVALALGLVFGLVVPQLRSNLEDQQFDDLEFGNFTRCPGGATQPIAGSNPFLDDGNLLTGGMGPNPKCDPSDVPPGP